MCINNKNTASIALLALLLFPTMSSHAGSNSPTVMSSENAETTRSVGDAHDKAAWAKPVIIPKAKNFYRVTDTIYRAAQPSRAAMLEYEKFGIRTIINLRALHNDRDEIKGTSLKLIEIPMNTWHIDDDEVIAALKILKDASSPFGGKSKLATPVLVHCQYGADRTGLIIAMYRIVFENWTKKEAIKEMREGGFGFHRIWVNISDYIEDVDIEKIKKSLAD